MILFLILFLVAFILLVRALDAARAPGFIVGGTPLCHVADRLPSLWFGAVFGFVPRLATVVAFAFKFSTSSFPFPITPIEVTGNAPGGPINTIHCSNESRLG